MVYNLEALASQHDFGVMEILNYYVKNSFSAYFEDSLPLEFFTRLQEMSQGYPALVAKAPDGLIAGFAFLHPYHPAPAFRAVAELTYFIAPDHTRQGLGGLFLERLIADGRKMGLKKLLASVSSLNEASLSFHQKQGFIQSGRLESVGLKFGREFDVVYLLKDI